MIIVKNILLFNKVSLLFLIGAMAYGGMTAGYMSACFTLIMSLSVVALVSTFQNKAGMSHTYTSGLFIGLVSMVWPLALVFLPLHLLLLLKPLSALSWKNVMAMLLGVLTPAWMYLPYFLYVHTASMDWLQTAEKYAENCYAVSFFDYSNVKSLDVILYGVLILSFFGLILYRTPYSYKGKVFVRTQRAVYMVFTWLLAIGLPFVPQSAVYLLPFMASCIGPVVAQKAMGDGR